MEKDIGEKYLDELLNKSIEGLPRKDENGSKNADKLILLNAVGFKLSENEKLLVKGDIEIKIQSLNDLTFHEIVRTAFDA